MMSYGDSTLKSMINYVSNQDKSAAVNCKLPFCFTISKFCSRKIKAAWTSSHKIKAGQDEEVSAEKFHGHGYYCAITRLVYMIYVYD